jgi:RNA polymerase sigma-70 factor (ECF subfamily)
MNLDTRSDNEVVQDTLLQPESFGVLIDRYSPKLLRYIRRITNVSTEDAEDLLQDVFIKAYQNLKGFDDSLKFSSWIYRIAHNVVVSSFRKKSIRPQTEFSALPEGKLQTFASELRADSEVMANDLAAAISIGMQQLDIKYREVLLLYYFEEYSYDEIADIIKKPPGTVATRISRAKKKLSTLLETTI